jgi:hypothetical protein
MKKSLRNQQVGKNPREKHWKNRRKIRPTHGDSHSRMRPRVARSPALSLASCAVASLFIAFFAAMSAAMLPTTPYLDLAHAQIILNAATQCAQVHKKNCLQRSKAHGHLGFDWHFSRSLILRTPLSPQ